jgi:hypothetical protein
MDENKQIAECFRAALKLMWDGNGQQKGKDERFICHALYEVAYIQRLPKGAAAISIIHARLNGSFTADGWLHRQGVKTFDNSVAIQAWRKQWLEQLIEEFENK